MAKRGVKSYEESTTAKVVPFRVIAAQLHTSPRVVEREFHSGVNKLKAVPGAFDAMLTLLRIKSVERRMGTRCGSVECNQDFIRENGGR